MQKEEQLLLNKAIEEFRRRIDKNPTLQNFVNGYSILGRNFFEAHLLCIDRLAQAYAEGNKEKLDAVPIPDLAQSPTWEKNTIAYSGFQGTFRSPFPIDITS